MQSMQTRHKKKGRETGIHYAARMLVPRRESNGVVHRFACLSVYSVPCHCNYSGETEDLQLSELSMQYFSISHACQSLQQQQSPWTLTCSQFLPSSTSATSGGLQGTSERHWQSCVPGQRCVGSPGLEYEGWLLGWAQVHWQNNLGFS